MIKEYIDYWNKDKARLEEHFKTHPQSKYTDYKDLVKLVFDIIINPNLQDGYRSLTFDTDNILVVDDGNYQGTQVFILHKKTYQPDVEEYVYTNTYYGSCSGCDTLLSIQDWDLGLPNEHQIKDYMLLCLHLLEKCHYMED